MGSPERHPEERAKYGPLLKQQAEINEEQRRVGWSVVVRGRMEAVDDGGDIERLQEAKPVAWAPGGRPHYLRLNPSLVSGRRISITDVPSNWWG